MKTDNFNSCIQLIPRSKKQHQHFNNLLNNLKMSPPPTVSTPLNYAHLYLVDSFYSAPGDPSSGLANSDRIRVTRDEKTGTVTECVRKIRLGDLNVYSPKRAADWRISVSVEIPGTFPFSESTAPLPIVENSSTPTRFSNTYKTQRPDELFP